MGRISEMLSEEGRKGIVHSEESLKVMRMVIWAKKDHLYCI